MSKERVNNIPRGWIKAKLSDVAHFVNGKAFKSQDWRNKGVPIIRIQNLNNLNSPYNYISETKYIEPQYKIAKGDLLFAWSGTPGTSFGAHIWEGEEAYLNQHIFRVIPFEGIEKNFLFHSLNYLVVDFVIRSKGTAGLSHITKKEFEATCLLVPPLLEQKRIADRIEELFSELDEANRILSAVQKKLILYSHVVLNDAFQGKFTLGEITRSDLRKNSIAQKILAIKQKYFQESIKEWRHKMKNWNKKLKKSPKPVKPTPQKTTLPLSKIELKELPCIPSGWEWIKINDVTLGVGYGSSMKSVKKGKVPVLRMGNIQNNIFQWNDLVYTNNKAEIEKYRLLKNDVLFNRTNSPELVGKSAIYKGEREAIFAGYLIRLNQISEIINGDYLNYYLNSPVAKSHGNKVKTDAVNQSNINGDKLINFPLPICSLQEQERVVEEIEYRLTISENLREFATLSQNKIQTLRYKVLDLAMTGNLSTQNLGEESTDLALLQMRKEKYLIEQKEIYMNNAKQKRKVQRKKSIVEILRSAGKPMSAKDVWLQSAHSGDIEEFYAELKELKGQILEIKRDAESLLTLNHANR